MGSGVDLHPEARVDIDKIAQFIARDGSLDRARRVVAKILDMHVRHFRITAAGAPILRPTLYASAVCMII
jgi:hypothetical protein